MSWYERPYSQGAGGGRSFADNPLNWTPTIGTLFGIRIKLHILFILFIFFELLQARRFFSATAHFLLIIFGSVFLHELGHCFAARRMGGRADEILMWPLGGLAFVDAPRAPWPQFVTVICGPLVNVVLFTIAGLLLLSGAAGDVSWKAINPLNGLFLFSDSLTSLRAWLILGFQVNTYMFLFNLWPMYPMDGGRMLHCALWSRMGHGRSLQLTAAVGMVAAVLLGMYGMVNGHWLLLGIAMLGYMTCYQERAISKMAEAHGEEFTVYGSSGRHSTWTEPATPRQGWWGRWRQSRKKRRMQASMRARDEENQAVDQILDKIKEKGIVSLTARERRILEEATRRQRKDEPYSPG